MNGSNNCWESKPKDPNRVELPDLVWIEEESKFEAIQRLLQRDATPPFSPTQPIKATMLVAHFEDTFQRLEEILNSAKPSVPIELAMASDLIEISRGGGKLDPSRAVEIVIAEHHPSFAHTEEARQAFRDLPFPTRVQFYCSGEEPTLEVLNGPFVQQMLEMGGFSSDVPIESGIVTRRLRQAQKKYDQQMV